MHRSTELRAAGFINPEIFALRGLEYRVRFCRAPRLVASLDALRRDSLFNAYLLRGEYDVVIVSVESSHVLFRALLDKRLDDLGLEGIATFTVGRFLKYHGCVVTAIRGDRDPASHAPETFHHLFNLTKDWNSAPEAWKATLLRDNLLMINPAGVPYERDGWASDRGSGGTRRTSVRVRFHRLAPDTSPQGFDDFLMEYLIPNPLVRNCYTAKPSGPYAFVFELVGAPGPIDEFLADFHRESSARFADATPVTRCDEVVTKLSEGHLNVLLTMQARPDFVAHAEERLAGSFFQEDRTGIVRFVEESEAAIRAIHTAALQDRCLAMLSSMQLAFQLDSPFMLRDAVIGVARELTALMLVSIARALPCESDEGTVIAELKRRRLFREHAATFGSVYPVFLTLRESQPPAAKDDGEQVFAALHELSNRLMLSSRPADQVNLTPAERADAEQVFCRLMRVMPAHFGDCD